MKRFYRIDNDHYELEMDIGQYKLIRNTISDFSYGRE